jgi:hypothetical protein
MAKKPLLSKKQRAAQQQSLPTPAPEPSPPLPAPEPPPPPPPTAAPVPPGAEVLRTAGGNLDVEICSGCGAVAIKHPMAGVMRDEETGLMAEFPVCHLCWTTPSHRTRTLKMHYFDRASAATAVEAAEKNIMVEPPS